MDTTNLKAVLSEILGEGKTIKEMSVTNLLPPGENFMSLIYRIEAKIQKNSSANSTRDEAANDKRVTEEEEELQLVTKLPAPADKLQQVFPMDFMFRKEIFFYEEIFPKYQELLNGTTLKCDIAPGYYGSKMDGMEDFAGLDGCIVFENLKSSGYYNGDRRKGMDMEHSKLAIEKLAVFHALGIAMMKLKPEVFEGFKEYCTNRFPDKMEQFDGTIGEIFGRLRKHDTLQHYVPRILKNAKSFGDSYKQVPAKPWVTIIHMDFWINNVMFHRSGDKVDDIKFIDFQTYCLASPMRDLHHFLFTSVRFEEEPAKTIDHLIDFYYEHFVNALKVLLKCEESSLMHFSRDRFNKQLAEDATYGLIAAILANKVLALNIDELEGDPNDRMTIVLAQTNDSCIDKLRKVILYFDSKQWI